MPEPSSDPPSPAVRSVGARWTPKLARNFTPVSLAFLELYRDLPRGAGRKRRVRRGDMDAADRGLTPTEALLIVHLISYKWDERAPFPTLATLAKRMGLTTRAVRNALSSLESMGYLRREVDKRGAPSKYHFEGLFSALEQLVDEREARRSEIPEATF